MNKDIIQLMEYLSKNKIISIELLEKYFHITRRQVLYKIEKINDFLLAQSVTPLQLNNKNIYILNEARVVMDEAIKSYNMNNYVFEKEERLAFIYILLFIRKAEDCLTTDYFIEELKVSRTTIFSDIKELKRLLEPHFITVNNNRAQGYYLSGKEIDIRNALMQFFISILSEEHHATIYNLIIKKNHLPTFTGSKEMIKKISKKYDIHFVEKRLDEFVYIFIFLFARLERSNSEIDSIQSTEMMTSFKEYKFTVSLIAEFKANNHLSQQELFYITSWTLSISFGNAHTLTKDFSLIANFVRNIMDRFNSISGFQYEFTDDTFNQLYAHMRPAYYRLLFHIPVINPLTSRVKKKYANLFRLVRETMKPFKLTFGREVPENEIAYLTIHFANIFKSKSQHFDSVAVLNKTPTALIVCSNGIGSSAILYNELTEIFPDLYFYKPLSILQMKNFEKKVDIIFTTDYISDPIFSQLPIVRIHPIISMAERYQLIHEVDLKLNKHQILDVEKMIQIIEKHADISNKQQLKDELTSFLANNAEEVRIVEDSHADRMLRLTDILRQDFIQLKVAAENWEEAIRLAYKPLLQDKIISQNYIEKTIRSVQLKGPYFIVAKDIALAHSRTEDGAFQNALGITVLNKPVSFGGKHNKHVKYIFSLSINGKSDHLGAMSELVELINDPEFFNLLNSTTEKKSVISYVASAEKNNM